MKKLTIRSAIVFSCVVGGALFAGNPPGTGQPNQSCETSMNQPGNAISAPGSAFNPNGVSGGVYANPDSRGGTASGNSHVVAQYDVGCFQQALRALKQQILGH